MSTEQPTICAVSPSYFHDVRENPHLMPLISVIVPTRNRADLVTRAAESVQRQTWPDWELIIIDDGSTDDTWRQLQRLSESDSRILPLRQDGRGAATARMVGVQAAQGEILVFLDSDDELVEAGLERFSTAMTSPDVAIACSEAIRVDDQGRVGKTTRPRSLGPAYDDFTGLFLAGTFAVRREVFDAVGGFALACRSSQHTELSLRVLPYCRRHELKVAVMHVPTVRIHDHADAHLRSNLQTLLDGALYIVDTHETQLRKGPRHYADWCAVAAVYAGKLGRFDIARRVLWKGLRYGQRKPSNWLRMALACCPPIARQVWKG